jgi:hypothetical protein
MILSEWKNLKIFKKPPNPRRGNLKTFKIQIIMKYKFLYTTPKGKSRNDIIIDSPDKETAIASFETDFPQCKFSPLNIEP